MQEILILVALGTERWEERRVQTKYCISEKPGDKGVLFRTFTKDTTNFS